MGSRNRANSDKNQATTFCRAYKRCYNSSKMNQWDNTDGSSHKSTSAGSSESRRYFATPWSIYDQQRKISVGAKFVAAQNSRAMSSGWEKWSAVSDQCTLFCKGRHSDELSARSMTCMSRATRHVLNGGENSL
jgi:hypothetical protein